MNPYMKGLGTLVVGLGLAACNTVPELPVESARTYVATPTQLSGALRDLAPGVRPGDFWSPYAVSAGTERTLVLTTERLDVPNSRATTTFHFEAVAAGTRATVSTAGMRGDFANAMNQYLLTLLGERFRTCYGTCSE